MADIQVGTVKRARITDVEIVAHTLAADVPRCGALVAIPLSAGMITFAAIADIEVEATALGERLARLELETDRDLPEEVRLDQTRGDDEVAITVKCVPIGFSDDKGLHVGSLPPQPPTALQRIGLCDDRQVRILTQSARFLDRLLDQSPDTLLAVVREALRAYPDQYHDRWLMRVCTRIAESLILGRGHECMVIVSAISAMRDE